VRPLALRLEIVQATKRLKAIAVDAATSGFLLGQFESRLALGEIEMKSGQIAAGRTRLAALEKEASEKGFILIARKAQRNAGD